MQQMIDIEMLGVKKTKIVYKRTKVEKCINPLIYKGKFPAGWSLLSSKYASTFDFKDW